MKTHHWLGLCAAAGLFVSVLIALPGQAQSQSEERAPRVASIHFIMEGFSKQSTAGTKSITKAAPASDKDWKKVERGLL